MVDATLLLATVTLAASAVGPDRAASPVPLDAAATPARPNIVFIMSDDHCTQAISCYGASAAPGLIATPGIDRIAREGMRFDRSSVTNAICGPSRAVMLTGKHSHANGFATNDQRFDGAQPTFPKLLREAGYRTEVVGKWHLASDPTGFDHWDVLVGQGDYWNPTFVVDGVKTVREGHVTDIIHREAVARLGALAEGARQGTPFALLVHHKAPHRNWMPQPRHYALFRDVAIPEPSTLFDDYAGRSTASSMQAMLVSRDLSWEYDLKVEARRLQPEGKPAQLDQWMANELGRLPAPVREGIRGTYLAENDALYAAIGGMVAHAQTSWKFQRYAKDYLRTAQGVDDSVGGILDELDRLGIARDTIVVYTSDQGWFLGEHGWYDKRWMYEESFRMPLVVRWPGQIPGGSASDALVQNLDFAPTFLEAAGVAIPPDMQGKSMLPLLRAGGAQDKPFREAVYYRFEESKGPHTVPRHEGVATDRHKLIRFLDLKDDAGRPLLELYDLEADPDERTSLAGKPSHAALEAALVGRLEALRAQYRAP
jgi:arylsulfatase A-like enzyme